LYIYERLKPIKKHIAFLYFLLSNFEDKCLVMDLPQMNVVYCDVKYFSDALADELHTLVSEAYDDDCTTFWPITFS
jgi:hypothetical protein